MAGVLHKLLRKPSCLKIITGLNSPLPSNLVVPLHQTHLSENKPSTTSNPNPFSSSLNGEKISSSVPLHIYPSFPFGYYLNSLSPSGFDQSEVVDLGSGESNMVWADSVKQKRKRKMNKHKYQKRRKLLRKKT